MFLLFLTQLQCMVQSSHFWRRGGGGTVLEFGMRFYYVRRSKGLKK
jgi:hypothetical protein